MASRSLFPLDACLISTLRNDYLSDVPFRLDAVLIQPSSNVFEHRSAPVFNGLQPVQLLPICDFAFHFVGNHSPQSRVNGGHRIGFIFLEIKTYAAQVSPNLRGGKPFLTGTESAPHKVGQSG